MLIFKSTVPIGYLTAHGITLRICSRLHGSVFDEYFKTSKCDKYNLMCSIEEREKRRNWSTSTNLLTMRQVVAVIDHFHKIQQNNQ